MVRDTIGYTSYSSSGVLIKEDEQKTINRWLPVTRKPNLRMRVLKEKMGNGMVGH